MIKKLLYLLPVAFICFFFSDKAYATMEIAKGMVSQSTNQKKLELIHTFPKNNSVVDGNKLHLQLVFNQNVKAGKDGFEIHTSDGTYDFIPADSEWVQFKENKVYINYEVSVDSGKEIYVLVDKKAIKSENNEFFKGFTLESDWQFRLSSSNETSSLFNHNLEPEFYPNPAKEKIYFQNIEEVDKIKIINLTGKTILEKESGDDSLIISKLPKGMYILIFIQKDGSHLSKKLIKK
jgi:hypothetical protein